MSENRGVYKNLKRGRQLIRFDGCDIPGTNITPTDIDAVYEYHDKAYLFIEVKCIGVDITKGQETFLKRITFDTAKQGKKTIGLLVEHNVINTDEDVWLTECIIKKIYYYSAKFNETKIKDPKKQDMKVKDFIPLFFKQYVDGDNNQERSVTTI